MERKEKSYDKIDIGKKNEHENGEKERQADNTDINTYDVPFVPPTFTSDNHRYATL